VTASWACPMSLARYAPVSRQVKPERPVCPACRVPMWFDGCYRRQIRQAGVVRQLVVHRVRCARCRAGHAVLPDFVVARRLDSADAIGAALATAAGAPGAGRARWLFASVPARTVRSWRARFAAQGQLWAGFSALAAGRGWQPADLPCATACQAAAAAIGAAWHTTLTRCPAAPLRSPWQFATAMSGGALLAIRMSVPPARNPRCRRRSRSP
jgi:hypothetical protein